jgi:hypothetical protein
MVLTLLLLDNLNLLRNIEKYERRRVVGERKKKKREHLI